MGGPELASIWTDLQPANADTAAGLDAELEVKICRGVEIAGIRVQRGESFDTLAIDTREVSANKDPSLAKCHSIGCGSHRGVERRNDVTVRVNLCDSPMCFAVYSTELPDDVDGAAVGRDGVDEVVDVWPERSIEASAVGVVRSDVGLSDRRATDVADLGEVADDDHSVADDDAVEYLTVEHLQSVCPWCFTNTGRCLSTRRQGVAHKHCADDCQHEDCWAQSPSKQGHENSPRLNHVGGSTTTA